MSVKGFDYRQAEDMIAHHLCDSMFSTWQSDHLTIFDFTTILAQEGMDSRATIVSGGEGVGIHLENSFVLAKPFFLLKVMQLYLKPHFMDFDLKQFPSILSDGNAI